MKTKRAHRLAAVLVLPLLLLVVGCDTGGGIATLPPEVADFKVDCFRPAGASQMLFEATGAIQDEGTIEGDALPVGQGLETWRGYRMLHGQNGSVTLYVDARFVSFGSSVAAGQFMIMQGHGAYEGLQGRGTFVASINEEMGLVEIFKGSLTGNPW